jgi:2,5-furandicarboxylate decarboxylase 1
MSYYSVRTRKRTLEERANLVTFSEPVDVFSSLPDSMKTLPSGKGAYFDKVDGFDMPVVSGMFGNREEWASFWDVGVEGITSRIRDAIANPIPWEIVPDGPCQQEVVDAPLNIANMLPVPFFSKRDSGRFLTSTLLFVKHPNTGKLQMSIRRFQVNDDSLSIYIKSPHLMQQFLSAEEQGGGLDVALVIGAHPALILASQLNGHIYDVDKVALAGALTGTPVPMVKCQTLDCNVPADAELVIEGQIVPDTRKPEGPFGELGDCYGRQTDKPIVKISRITKRRDAWYQAIHPLSDDDHKLPGALMNEVVIYDTVKRLVPGVRNVHSTLGGAGFFHAVISIEKRGESDGKDALLAALSSYPALKHVVVVNHDVDIFSARDVEWAIATRVQADRDVVIISGTGGSTLDPSYDVNGTGAKMGVDATYPLEHAKHFERISQ